MFKMGTPNNKCRQFPTRIHQHNVKGIYKFHPQVNTPPVVDSEHWDRDSWSQKYWAHLELGIVHTQATSSYNCHGEPLILNTENKLPLKDFEELLLNYFR